MKTIFELAAFFQDRAALKGDFPPPQYTLDVAACRAVEGYASLEEAEEETLTRFDGWGNEIEPSVIFEAVLYLRNARKFTAQHIRQIGVAMDSQDAAKIERLPESKHFDKLADELEAKSVARSQKFEQVAGIIEQSSPAPVSKGANQYSQGAGDNLTK